MIVNSFSNREPEIGYTISGFRLILSAFSFIIRNCKLQHQMNKLFTVPKQMNIRRRKFP